MEILFPYLLCTFPIHSIFAQNSTEISVFDYIFSLVLLVIVITLGVLGLNFFIGDIYVAEIIFCIIYFLLVYANYIFISQCSQYKRSLIKYQLTFLALFIICCVALSGIVVLVTKLISAQIISKIIFYTTAFITFFVIVDITKQLVELYTHNKQQTVNIKTLNTSNLPDIYHIIADSHTGFDREGLCDEDFKKALKERGFEIYEKAKSNYNYTACSVPSMMNMEYIKDLADIKENFFAPTKTLKYYGNNAVSNILTQQGYHLTKVTFNSYKHLLNNRNSKKKFILLKVFLNLSILYIFKELPDLSLKNANLKEIQSELKNFVREKINAPKYFIGHLLAPHFPYVCREDGTPNKLVNIKNVKYYFPYLKYIDKQLIKSIDDIKSNMNENSIIIIHGDHSIASHNDDRFKILLAIYFPKQYNPKCINNDCTLVNLFRRLFNEIFKTDYPILEDKFFPVQLLHGQAQLIESEEVFKTTLVNNNFQNQLKKLEKKYKNKRILIYGTGIFFKAVQNNYDLSNLNIIGISDIKFKNKEIEFDEEYGYKKISPENIYKFNPDIILIGTINPFDTERYLNQEIFKDKRNRIKYSYLFQENIKIKINNFFNNCV